MRQTMAGKGEIVLAPWQFWTITLCVIVVTAFVGIMCGVTPQCVPLEEETPLSARSVQEPERSRRQASVPWEDFRLPRGVVPLQYRLLLNPDLEDVENGGTENFTGSVDILVDVIEATEYPRVHIKEMTILTSAIRNEGTDEMVDIVDEFFYAENEFYVMNTGGPLAIGQYTISLTFTGSLVGHIVGFYKSTYTTPGGEKRVLATSKFQPTDARRAFPCFDEPHLKATFITTLVHDPKYTALSNMDVENSETLDGMEHTHFSESVKMSTYLACFIVCDFHNREITLTKGKPFRVYAPDFQIDQAMYALEAGASITNYFEEYYDVEYPLPKLDMIAIPDFSSGAMEHWGLITYRERYMLYDENESSASNKQRILAVVAHELAHMWFGNIVTMEWWDDLWLNEGFASYVEYIGAAHVEPDWQMFDQFVPTDLLYVFGLDQITTSHPIIVDLEHPDEINEVFDSIPYSKGSSVLRMLNNFIGEATFKEGVSAYLKEFEFGTARSEDLWRNIQMVHADKGGDSSINVQRIMDTWTRQMGFPVVNVTRGTNSLQLEQSWFLVDPNADKSAALYDSAYNYRWEIPFTYVYEPAPSDVNTLWMQWDDTDSDKISLPVGDNWYLANYKEMNFYRVNYDLDNWDALSDQLTEDFTVIEPADRAGLIDDAFNLGRAEQLDYDVVLDLTMYLQHETEYVPWTVAHDNLEWMSEMLRFQDIYGDFREYIVDQTGDLYDRVGWNGTEDHLETRLRSDAIDLACGHGNQECLEEAILQFNKVINRGDVPPDIRSAVYTFGAQEMARQDEWNIMWDLYRESTVASEKLRLLHGMAFTREVWLLSRFLEYTKDEDLIRSQDFFSVVTYISNNPVGNPLAWDWIRANWEYLVDRFGTSNRYLGRLVPSITYYYSTDLKLQEMEEFFEKYPEGGAGERGRKQALERVRTNINWVNRNVAVIEAWLTNSQSIE